MIRRRATSVNYYKHPHKAHIICCICWLSTLIIPAQVNNYYIIYQCCCCHWIIYSGGWDFVQTTTTTTTIPPRLISTFRITQIIWRVDFIMTHGLNVCLIIFIIPFFFVNWILQFSIGIECDYDGTYITMRVMYSNLKNYNMLCLEKGRKMIFVLK